MKQDIIKYGGGKSELIRIGAFDNVNIAIGHHITPDAPGYILANGTTNGFFNKIVNYYGKAAHAAAYPEKGKDALNAAMLAMHAIDMQRETFKDEDSVRIHGFLSKAGEAVNVIAENTCMESSIRAKNITALRDAGEKYNRSIRAGAVGMGCDAEIITMPGYLPTVPLKDTELLKSTLLELSEENKLCGNEYPVEYRTEQFHEAGSTDYGDLSSMIPLYQFRTGGFSGELHNSNFCVKDEQLAYVEAAKIYAILAYKLLKDHAKEALHVVEEFEPVMRKEKYCEYMESVNKIEHIYAEVDK